MKATCFAGSLRARGTEGKSAERVLLVASGVKFLCLASRLQSIGSLQEALEGSWELLVILVRFETV